LSQIRLFHDFVDPLFAFLHSAASPTPLYSKPNCFRWSTYFSKNDRNIEPNERPERYRRRRQQLCPMSYLIMARVDDPVYTVALLNRERDLFNLTRPHPTSPSFPRTIRRVLFYTLFLFLLTLLLLLLPHRSSAVFRVPLHPLRSLTKYNVHKLGFSITHLVWIARSPATDFGPLYQPTHCHHQPTSPSPALFLLFISIFGFYLSFSLLDVFPWRGTR
jgi:hypothetical protein